MVAERRLSQKLKLLLSHPRILKAGRLVSADLKCLEATCQSHVPFVGGLNLANMQRRDILHRMQNVALPICPLWFSISA